VAEAEVMHRPNRADTSAMQVRMSSTSWATTSRTPSLRKALITSCAKLRTAEVG
jgi:hypothetical protein